MMRAAAAPALETRGLGVAYGGRRALCDVSLTMARGEITAIAGPSGCGKSSFLMALNRLHETIPGCTVSGQVRLFGTPIDRPGMPPEDLRRRVAMIFQRPAPFPTSVRRNLAIPIAAHYRATRRELGDRAEAALRMVGLWDEVADRLDSPAMALSGGQQQRLCLARAMALEPDILLLDEPTSALDPLAARHIEELLSALKERLSLVLVTHNLAQARRLADRVALFWVKEGCGFVVEDGPAERVFTSPASDVAQAYFAGELG